ncbi:MAG TPA: hypothetical protein VH394_16430 [Thermoanaerobaculia bacterium]|nr:hypothetical protein [Thermoanaerobaculia bacterium]
MVHIAFLTLFLGLTSGSQPFELSVSGQAARVEMVLDGTVVQRLGGPPWKGKIDFGAGLLPHELVARALDPDGREVASARQWINLPRPPAEVELALEGGRSGAPSRVRVTWERLTHDPPLAASLTLDGQPLQLDRTGEAALPAYDRDSTHVLTAELRFPSNIVARKDMIFGGEGGETYTELTAVPVRLLRGRKLPKPADLQGWFVDGQGRPLKVTAVEDGPGELYLVRVPSTDYVKLRFGLGLRSLRQRLPAMTLGKDDLIRMVSPWSRSYLGGGARSDLFDLSPHSPSRYGLTVHLLESFFKRDGTEVLRPADAVAVAGLHAMAGGRRRVVVLVLDADSGDESLYDPETVRRYLSAIRVPLYVWSINRDTSSMQAWGEIQDASKTGPLETAFRKAAADLEHQRIVLIEGRYLPQSIRLSPKATEIEIVAAGER